ncbi:MAG: MFS transporter [Patescibacteria group bacterium]|nr:MFS transporter [Patescibacteria group bacterium]
MENKKLQLKSSFWIAFILGFIGFVTSFGAHIVAVNLPTYAKEVGIGLAMIGLLIAAYDLAEIVSKPIFGAIADRQGMKRTMMAGIAVFILASALYLIIPPSLLLLIRFMQGVGAAALSAVSLALVAEYFKENRGRAYGIYNAIKGSGYVISPIVGGFLVFKSNFASIFIASAIIGIIAFVLAVFLPKTEDGGKEAFREDDEMSLKAFTKVFRDPVLLPWYLVIVINMFFVGILFGFLPVYISNLGYTPFQSGIIISVVALSYLLIQPVAGILADKNNPVVVIKTGLVLSALAIIFITFTHSVLFIILSIIAGVGVGTVWTNTDTLMSKLAKEGRLGETMGIAGSFKEFGDMVGPLLIGLLSQTLGLSSGFLISGVLGLFSILFIRKIKN